MRIMSSLLCLCFITTLMSSHWTSSESENNYIDHTFHIVNSNPIIYFKDMIASLEFDVFSVVDCAGKCTRFLSCNAFYLSPNHDNDFPYHCIILSERLGQAHFSTENGVLGTLQNSPVTAINFQSPPDTYRYIGDLQGMQKNEAGISVVYDLSRRNSKMTNMGILFDEETNAWPELSPACSAQLKYQAGLSGAFLKITKIATRVNDFVFSAVVVCPFPEDMHHGDAVCEGLTGIWTLTGDLNVGCVSSHCYRYNGIEHAIYNGVQSDSGQGVTCQRWDSQVPHPHIMTPGDFPVDDYNITEAENYCRDPDGEGFPWCYQIAGKRWESCDIPICRI